MSNYVPPFVFIEAYTIVANEAYFEQQTPPTMQPTEEGIEVKRIGEIVGALLVVAVASLAFAWAMGFVFSEMYP